MQSIYRKFTRERIARRKAGGGYDARSTRGLQALGFIDHSLPHHPHNDLLKSILLCDLPANYHTKGGVNGFHVPRRRAARQPAGAREHHLNERGIEKMESILDV